METSHIMGMETVTDEQKRAVVFKTVMELSTLKHFPMEILIAGIRMVAHRMSVTLSDEEVQDVARQVTEALVKLGY